MSRQIGKRVEAPKQIGDVIASVVGAPLEDIGNKLQELELKYDKLELSQWVDLLEWMGRFFAQFTASRQDLLLQFKEPYKRLEWDAKLDHNVLQVLSTLQVLVEASLNKSPASSLMPHLARLLACPNPEVVTAVLRVLVAYVKKPQTGSRFQGMDIVGPYLEALVKGWPVQHGIDLVSSVTPVSGSELQAAQMQESFLEMTILKTTVYEQDRAAMMMPMPTVGLPKLEVDLGRLGERPEVDPYELLAGLLKQTEGWPSSMTDASRQRHGLGCTRGWSAYILGI